MPSVPPENSADLIRLYRDQLELKDAHIAALTNLLKEANARLAQQQSISEGILAGHSGATGSHESPSHGQATESKPAQEETNAVVDQRLLEESEVSYAHAVAADYSGNHGKELAFASVALPQEAGAEADAEDDLPSLPLKPFSPEAGAVDTGAAPIPMSYFGPPIANLAQNLKEATAESDPLALSEIREPDEEKYTAIRNRLAEGRAKSEQAPPTPRWPVPALAIAVVALATAAFFIPWKKLTGQTHPGMSAVGKVAPMDLMQPANDSAAPSASSSPSLSPPPTGTPELSGLQAGGSALQPPAGTGAGSAALQPPASAQAKLQSPVSDAQLVDVVSRAELKQVRKLLTEGANVNARNDHQSSVLAMAARQGNSEIVKLLLTAGADVNAGNDKGWTALMLAVNYRRKSIVNALLKHGARTDLANSQGTTALMLAAQVGDKPIVTSLLAGGAPVTLKNSSGLTAYDVAVRKHHPEIAALLERAASVNQ